MDKTFHYLSGLPRSGNTLISSLLNQNPNIHSSALSPVCGYVWEVYQSSLKQESVLRNKNKFGTESIISNILPNHYSNINKPIIFDREKAWGTPANLALIKTYFTKEPKIVYTARPIIDMLASFINLGTNWIDQSMINYNWNYKTYLSPDDNRCDYLMRPWGEIDQGLLTLNEMHKEENNNIFHIIEYDNLINNPQQTMNELYKFINIDSYQHNFNNIIKIEVDDDSAIGMPENTHEVRLKLKKTSPKPEDVLSDYTLSKYSNMEFWRK